MEDNETVQNTVGIACTKQILNDAHTRKGRCTNLTCILGWILKPARFVSNQKPSFRPRQVFFIDLKNYVAAPLLFFQHRRQS